MKNNLLVVLMAILFICGCISKPPEVPSIYLIQHISSGKFVGPDGLTNDLNNVFSDLDKKKMEEIRNNLDKKEEYRIHEIWAFYDKSTQEYEWKSKNK